MKLFRDTDHSSLLDTRSAAAMLGSSGKANWHPLAIVLLVSAWLTLLCNYPLWQEMARIGRLQTGSDYAFAAGLGLIIFTATALVLGLFAWRWLIKPVAIFLLLVAAASAYFMAAYNVVIDTTMVINALATDPRETRDLINWKMLLTLAILGILPSVWLLRQRLRSVRLLPLLLANALFSIACCVLLTMTLAVFFQNFSSTMRNHTHLRFLINPLNVVYALGDIAAKPFKRDTKTLLPIGQDAALGASYAATNAAPANKPPLLLLVLGETARAGNFSLNGYARETNPLLAKQNVVSLRNVWSCGTSTEASVPCMFSHLGKEAFEGRKSNYEGLLDVIQRAGLAVLWIDNQSGCKGTCNRVPNVNTANLKNPAFCASGECHDAVMLDGLDARIAELPADKRAKGVVVVLHQMGSHGPSYFKRTPPAFQQFKPFCATNSLQDCQQEQIVNAYDNTILYTDHFLNLAINWLNVSVKWSSPAMLYVSDHGESLGENNLYLHGLPYAIAPDVQKRVPWITWLSPEYSQRSGITNDCLTKQLNTRLSHDNYFHSVLGMLDVKTALYRADWDVYAGCKK